MWTNTSKGLLATKAVLFEEQAGSWFGLKYLSLQTTSNMFKMFRFSAKNKSFEEEEALRLCLGEGYMINFTEFDERFEHIFIVKNSKVLEKRKIGMVDEVVMSVNLKESGRVSRCWFRPPGSRRWYCLFGGFGEQDAL